jgi:hypothetical protein
MLWVMRDGTACDRVDMTIAPLWRVVEERAALLFWVDAARSCFCLGNQDDAAVVPHAEPGAYATLGTCACGPASGLGAVQDLVRPALERGGGVAGCCAQRPAAPRALWAGARGSVRLVPRGACAISPG